ncbi:HdeD family acid-resistance protein [Legionella londiniensis]|uniref:Acid-resistance membrane protein n=1 Tax=Legionella londiniensis TaxID=45068 RepID=A0A0W0VIN7_9GAMM|nr:DUF308 domain-containing protein [Legionella londiniensis]KTD19702.1 acid-resistance membrane protein [Legionella londiniensis]STX92388.1 HdeD protein [Legionella londiniensis]
MTSTEGNMQTLSPKLQRNWGWLLFLGIIFILLGSIGLGMLVGLTLVSVLFLGILLIIGGAAQVIDALRSKHWKGALWHLLVALLYIAGGIIIFYDPILASAALTALLASVLIIIGALRFFMALSLRGSKGWGWLMFAGLIAILLGILILAQWPWSGLWVIGLFLAIDLIVSGWTYIFIAVALRNMSA